MKDNFEYWVHQGGRHFLTLYWIQYALFYVLAIGLALKTKNPFVFLIIGFLPYIPIVIFRRARSPFGSLENGIKENDNNLYERLLKGLPEQYDNSSKYRAGYFFTALLKEPETTLNPTILLFKRNYHGINKQAGASLLLWFITLCGLGAYLYINR